MTGIVIVTHGNLAQELANTVSMVFGTLDEVYPICLTQHKEVDDLKKELREIMDKYREAPLIFMTDLFGGSAFNASALAMRKGVDLLIAGVNMPILLDVLYARDSGGVPEIRKEITSDLSKYIVVYDGGPE